MKFKYEKKQYRFFHDKMMDWKVKTVCPKVSLKLSVVILNKINCLSFPKKCFFIFLIFGQTERVITLRSGMMLKFSVLLSCCLAPSSSSVSLMLFYVDFSCITCSMSFWLVLEIFTFLISSLFLKNII